MLLDSGVKLIATLQYAFWRELIEQCSDGALHDVLFLRAARSGPWC